MLLEGLHLLFLPFLVFTCITPQRHYLVCSHAISKKKKKKMPSHKRHYNLASAWHGSECLWLIITQSLKSSLLFTASSDDFGSLKGNLTKQETGYTKKSEHASKTEEKHIIHREGGRGWFFSVLVVLNDSRFCWADTLKKVVPVWRLK